MPQFQPFPQFLPGDQVDVVDNFVFDTAPLIQPSMTAPLDLIGQQLPFADSDQYVAFAPRATDELTAFSAPLPGTGPLASYGLPTTGQHQSLRTQTNAAPGQTPEQSNEMTSLLSALQSTLSNTTGRMVVIPADQRYQRQRQRQATKTGRRLSPRQRHGIVATLVVLIVMATLVTLTPLAGGQSGLPILGGINHWFQTQDGSWQVAAHNISQPVVANQPVTKPLPPVTLPKSQYVAIARQDAINVGINPDYFVRQIALESSFNPNAVSGAGAVGIAQFLPSTAAGLGIDPWNPVQALAGAAKLMSNYSKNYGGDYAKALAAYNAGSGTLQNAVARCGANWLSCMPPETQNYVNRIMG